MIELSPAALTLLMFGGLIIGLAMGAPLCFVLGGLATVVGFIGWGPEVLNLLVNRIFALMGDYVLVSIPLFILMAQFLDRSGIAEKMFNAIMYVFGPIRGGLAVAVISISVLFAACTGIIGASVVTMGLLALPVMIKNGYSKSLSTGTICAGGTLGILIPPSIMLIVMGSQATLSVGKLFAGAIIPGLILAGLYIIYILVRCYLRPMDGPPLPSDIRASISAIEILIMCLKSVFPPLILIIGVLGSIFWGIATPTEASGVGAFLALSMVVIYGRFTWKGFYEAIIQCTKTCAMVSAIMFGASCFTAVLLGLGGGDVISDMILSLGWGKWGTYFIMMLICFVLGMFIDWIGIVMITFPIFLPIADQFGIDKLWFIVSMAVMLQDSFVTPPFGYALFYIKGVSPPSVSMKDIYYGIHPYWIIMEIGLIICIIWPQTIMWLPSIMVGN